MRALLAVLVALVCLAGCGRGDDDSASAGGDTTEVTECAEVDAPQARDPEPSEAPTTELDASKTHTLTFDTSCGSFTVTLDPEEAPKTTASLVALAKAGYFDETIFHRVVPGFVIQSGDPTQSGAGGPGYSTVDVPPPGSAYTQGVVAMAKSGVEAPGTAGSQFFVVTGADAGLPPEYAIVGEVTEGMETVLRIDALGVGDGPPSHPVVVNTVTVGES
ncbi:MAG TPA: peptidylprolyl isomerase [Gaiellaceae bacterium]|nr:peptidylprolyl isomerase [Gaiellaceae bacterium]